MKASQIYTKTLKFVWMKLALGLATVLLSGILLAICLGLTVLFKSSGATFIMFCIWLAGTGIIDNILNHYFGYLVKAGHIAMVATAVSTGQLPENQFEAATEMVKKRFITSNVYFVVDRLVSGAVKQLQNTVTKIDSLFGNIPAVNAIMSFAKIFIGIALGYVDECCLGYTFMKPEQGAFKSAADGVVIYFQNWKRLLKNAFGMTIMVIVTVIVSTLLVFAIFGGLFSLLHWPGIFGFLISFFVAYAIKTAFIDSYMMVKMMVSYLEVAPQTEITFDLYGKLCKLSKKFKELFNKGEEEKVSVA